MYMPHRVTYLPITGKDYVIHHLLFLVVLKFYKVVVQNYRTTLYQWVY